MAAKNNSRKYSRKAEITTVRNDRRLKLTILRHHKNSQTKESTQKVKSSKNHFLSKTIFKKSMKLV